MKKIVWFSRHEALPSQRLELGRKFGSYELIVDLNPFAGAEDIAERFRAVGGHEMVVVAPVPVMAELIKLGHRPLRAVMEEVSPSDPRCEVVAAGRGYRFVEFQRVLELRLITEPL